MYCTTTTLNGNVKNKNLSSMAGASFPGSRVSCVSHYCNVYVRKEDDIFMLSLQLAIHRKPLVLEPCTGTESWLACMAEKDQIALDGCTVPTWP